MRTRTAAALLGLLFATHLGVSAARVDRIPAQEKTFHDHDLALVRHAMIVRGAGWAPALPVAELVPPSWSGLGAYDLLSVAHSNGPEGIKSYRTFAPLHYLVSAIPAALFGVSLWTVRLGPLAVLALLLAATADAARVLARQDKGDDGWWAGLFAALLVSTVPVGWLGVLVGVPTLGNLTGVALALWALVRSDGLRRWWAAALAGVLVVAASRWGESVGDALACLTSLAGPLAVAAAMGLLAGPWRQRGRALVGIALCGGLIVLGLDWTWLQTHLQLYVLDEAQLSAEVSLAEVAARSRDNLVAYGRALGWSLLGPAGAAIAAAGGVGALALAVRAPRVLVALASPVSGLLALSLSAKGHDYYAAPVVAGLAMAAAVGLARVPRVGGALCALGAGGLVASWLVTANLDAPSLSSIQCKRSVRTWLAGDPSRCDPRGGREEAVYPWFREWRRKPAREVLGRRKIGTWLWEGDGRAWLESLPPEALVLLQVPPGPGGGADVFQLVAQSLRPDVLVHRVEGGMQDGRSDALLRWAKDHDNAVAVVTFMKRMHTRSEAVQHPQRWMGAREPGPQMELLTVWSVPPQGP